MAPGTAEELEQLGADVEAAIDELRALARGVFADTLTSFDPAMALREAVRGAPIPTTITAGGVGRFSEQVEPAVYFCCMEALQNTYKHASTATAARVSIRKQGRDLTFEIADDGEGFDDAAAGTGCATCTTESPRSADSSE